MLPCQQQVPVEDWQLTDEVEDHAPEFKHALLLLMLKLNMHTILSFYMCITYTLCLKKSSSFLFL